MLTQPHYRKILWHIYDCVRSGDWPERLSPHYASAVPYYNGLEPILYSDIAALGCRENLPYLIGGTASSPSCGISEVGR